MERKIVWNSALRYGLILGGISIAYMIVNMLLGKLSGNGVALSVFANVGGVLLWLLKIYLCIHFFKAFMQKFAAANQEATNADTFRFGFAMAVLSALLYAAFYLAWVTLIQPDILSDSLEVASEAYSNILTADQLESMEELLPKLPGFSFVANLIYCTAFGTVLSAIFSRNIPSRNPFQE